MADQQVSRLYELADSTKKITVQDHVVDVPQPFVEGHQCTDADASTLNQTYAENVRNNTAKKISEFEEKAKAEGKSEAEIASGVQEIVDEYVMQYDFGVRQGGFRTADPVEREALEMAKKVVEKKLKDNGHKLKDVGAAKIKELAQQLVDKHPQFRERAEQVVAARQEVAVEIEGISA